MHFTTHHRPHVDLPHIITTGEHNPYHEAKQSLYNGIAFLKALLLTLYPGDTVFIILDRISTLTATHPDIQAFITHIIKQLVGDTVPHLKVKLLVTGTTPYMPCPDDLGQDLVSYTRITADLADFASRDSEDVDVEADRLAMEELIECRILPVRFPWQFPDDQASAVQGD